MAILPNTPSNSSSALLSLLLVILKFCSVPFILALVILLSLLLASCGSSTSGGNGSGNTLVFGAPISLTGSTSTEGQLTQEGYKLWVKEVNAGGGIKVGNKTYQVQLKYYDDGSAPTKSAQ